MLCALLSTQHTAGIATVDSFMVHIARLALSYTTHENQQVVDQSFKLLNCLVSFKPKMEREYFQALEMVSFLQEGCLSVISRCQEQTSELLAKTAARGAGKIPEDVRKQHQSLRGSMYEILASIGLSDVSDNFLVNSHLILSKIFEHSECTLEKFSEYPVAASYILSDTLKDVVGVMTGINFSEVMLGFLRISYPKVQKLIQTFDSLGDIMSHQEFLLGFMEYQYRLCKLISEKVYKHTEVTLTAMISLFQMTNLIGRFV